MLQKTEFIWFDGKLVPWDQAQVHVLAHGLHYGTGVFEGIRAYACPDGSSAVFRLPEHSKRLVNSAKILGIDMPYTADEISKAIVETVVANKLSEGYIRPLAFAGEGDMCSPATTPRTSSSPCGPGAPTSEPKPSKRASASRPAPSPVCTSTP